MSPKTISDESEMKSGLTWRSFLGLIYVILIFQPALTFLYLRTGQIGLASAVRWTAVILLMEIASLAGGRLTVQEAIIIFLGGFVASQFNKPLNWVYQLYFKYSPAAYKLGLADKVPYFYAPANPDVWMQRTFIDPSWIPVLALAIGYLVVYYVADISLGIMYRKIFLEVEKLPFPMAQPIAEAVEVLAEKKEPSRLTWFTLASIVSFIYGIIVFTLPPVFTAFNLPVMTVPIPWVEFNFYIHRIIPGASFGIATDFFVLAIGFIIPIKAAIGMFIGSFALYFIGNALLVRSNLTTFASEWSFGMTVAESFQRSILYVWVTPIVFAGLAMGVAPILTRPSLMKSLLRTFRGSQPGAAEEKTQTRFWLILIPYLGATISITVVNYVLAPDLPIWLPIWINILFPLVFMLAEVRAEGEAIAFSVPFSKELMLKAGGYTGYNAWFVPMFVPSSGWVTDFKTCALTKTSYTSYVKVALLTIPIGIILGFIFVSRFWTLGPMPSAYRGLEIYWPVSANMQAVLYDPKSQFFNLTWGLGGFVIFLAYYVILMFLNLAPVAIGTIIGMGADIPTVTTMLLGAILGRMVFAHLFGNEWWNRHKTVIMAGVGFGEGIAVTLGMVFSLVMSSMWLEPF